MKIPQNHSQNDKTEFDVRKEELFRVLVYIKFSTYLRSKLLFLFYRSPEYIYIVSAISFSVFANCNIHYHLPWLYYSIHWLYTRWSLLFHKIDSILHKGVDGCMHTCMHFKRIQSHIIGVFAYICVDFKQ
jgi:hypothetical protein